MDNPLSDNSINNEASEPGPTRPVLLLFLGGWGVAPAGEANFIRSSKIPNWLELIKDYPVALLQTGHKTLNARYLSLGAGQDIKDENFVPPVTLTKILADANCRQLKIAETERFAALTHFFNGQAQNKARGEEWIIVSSENNARALKLSLALKRTVKEIVKALNQEKPYDFIAASIPTVDIAAASGDLSAVTKAVAALDKNLKIIVDAVLNKKGLLVITAAAGNAEKMLLPGTEVVDSGLTTNPVPFLVIGEEFKGKTIGLAEPLSTDLSLLEPAGTLADVAPTILRLMNLTPPPEMSGRSLIDK